MILDFTKLNFKKDKVVEFAWQHFLLLVSLFIMTLGVALCVRSALGSSVISAIPYVLSRAGVCGYVPEWTIGTWTCLMNCIFVSLQILILRRQFEKIQLFQLLIGFFFGWLIDINMALTSMLQPDTLLEQTAVQVIGCTTLGIGIAFEIRCGSITMPGEGMPAAISKISSLTFAKAKIYVDITLVVIAVMLSFLFFSKWLWEIVGPGTLFAMLYVGMVVKFLAPHLSWFDRILGFHPGFRRYIYGLARMIHR